MAVSNNVTAALNLLALLCSIPIISAGVWLASKQGDACVRLALRCPFLVLVLLVALAGFVGAYWRMPCLLACYLFAMTALVLAFLVLLVLAFVVTRADGTRAVRGGVREYRLEGYSTWLREHVVGGGGWGRIKGCLRTSDVYGKVGRGYPVASWLVELGPL